MKRFGRWTLISAVVIAIIWTVLTLYVEGVGAARSWKVSATGDLKVLIVFDPDPFYNLDPRVCMAFGNAIADSNIQVTVATIGGAEDFDLTDFNAVVFCANTYNWRPDWAVVNYIESHELRELDGDLAGQSWNQIFPMEFDASQY